MICDGSVVAALSRLLRRGLGADGPEQAVEAVLRVPLPLSGGLQARLELGGVQLPSLLPGQVPHPAPSSGCSGRGTYKSRAVLWILFFVFSFCGRSFFSGILIVLFWGAIVFLEHTSSCFFYDGGDRFPWARFHVFFFAGDRFPWGMIVFILLSAIVFFLGGMQIQMFSDLRAIGQKINFSYYLTLCRRLVLVDFASAAGAS